MRTALRLLVDHLGPALIIGGLASWWFQDWRLIGIALLTGWLIDTDHLVDFAYFLLHRKPGAFDRSMLTTGAYFRLNGKVIVPLHSWELALLWALAWSWAGEIGIAVTGSLAWMAHLFYDQISYRVTPLGYFFSYRAKHRFAHAGFCSK
jgi:hypothetical protein